jgi:hypothetical protein
MVGVPFNINCAPTLFRRVDRAFALEMANVELDSAGRGLASLFCFGFLRFRVISGCGGGLMSSTDLLSMRRLEPNPGCHAVKLWKSILRGDNIGSA